MKRKTQKPKKASELLDLPELTKEEKERREAKKTAPIKISLPKVGQQLRNIYSTRVVVKSAPSGQRYDFAPGEAQFVNSADINHLLSLKRTSGCGKCGGSGPYTYSYFEEV